MIPILIIIIKKTQRKKRVKFDLKCCEFISRSHRVYGQGACINDIHSKLTYDDGLANSLEIVKTNCYVGTIGH